MIIKIESADGKEVQQYSFSGRNAKVILGRKPISQEHETLTVDEPTASRTHLLIKIKKGKIVIQDLLSSNGTKVNNNLIEAGKFIEISSNDYIQVGEAQGKIKVAPRVNDSSESSNEALRSREKKKTDPFSEFKISDSTLKMLRQMTMDRKSQEEKIKFLKLMGCKNVEEGWEKIEGCLKKEAKFKSSSKKTTDELEMQFVSGRFASEKKGLGKK